MLYSTYTINLIVDVDGILYGDYNKYNTDFSCNLKTFVFVVLIPKFYFIVGYFKTSMRPMVTRI